MQFHLLENDLVRILFVFAILLGFNIALIAAIRLAVVRILANILTILENQQKLCKVIFETEIKVDNVLKTFGAYDDSDE